MLASYDYDAFGNQKDVVENIYNPFRYCGEYADEETGLIYLRARYYEPGAGRFISEDPAKDGMNWYVYCANDPVNFVDPSGLDAALDNYVNQYYGGQMTITIAAKRPVANSRDVAQVKDGKLDNGHSFLRLDNGQGRVLYIGFAAVNPSVTDMVLGNDVDGRYIDDSASDWNVAVTYHIDGVTYDKIVDYINNSVENNTQYNIESNNCTTFAANAIIDTFPGGFYFPVYPDEWVMPDNLTEQLKSFEALPDWLPAPAGAALVSATLGDNYGYTPAGAAQDLKKAPGYVALKYNGSVNVIYNN